jgi:hypothetical protein
LAPLAERDLRFLYTEPRRVSKRFLGGADLVNLHQKSLYGKLTNPGFLPKHTLRVKINVKMGPVNDAHGTRLLQRLIRGSLTVRQVRLNTSFREGPLSSIGVYQKKLDS